MNKPTITDLAKSFKKLGYSIYYKHCQTHYDLNDYLALEISNPKKNKTIRRCFKKRLNEKYFNHENIELFLSDLLCKLNHSH